MSTLTKQEISQALFDKMGFNKKDCKQLVDDIFEEIRGVLESGDDVKLSGFGKFVLRDKNSRPGRNPKTGEEIPISARRVVTFHASAALKEAVNHGNES